MADDKFPDKLKATGVGQGLKGYPDPVHDAEDEMGMERGELETTMPHRSVHPRNGRMGMPSARAVAYNADGSYDTGTGMAGR